jgi:hypothetical protein
VAGASGGRRGTWRVASAAPIAAIGRLIQKI